jgi:amidase
MPHRLSLVRMAEMVRRKQISARELRYAHLLQIERLNPRVNAFIEIFPDAPAGPGALSGVPVTVKDSFDVRGCVTNCGSLLRHEAVAREDSTPVSRLRNAGAAIIGRTSTPEFLYYYETDNRIIGRTNNPWDLHRTSGGSSGGEAAAIASCMSAGGIGSDGGGSIREPAHFCGICGLKPTPGRVPAFGHWPEICHPTGFMGVAGPMARSAEDVRLLFRVLAGHDPRDPFSVPIDLREMRSEKAEIFVMEKYGETPVARACARALERAVGFAGDLGHRCEAFPFELIAGAHDLWRTLFVDFLTPGILEMVAGREDECSWTGLELTKLAREQVDAARLSAVLVRRDRMRARLLEWMGERKLILAPAFGVNAFPHRQRTFAAGSREIDLMEAIQPVSPWNLLGMPALSLPMIWDEDGLPAGVQIVGAPYTEELLLDLAIRMEQARGNQWSNEMSSRLSTINTSSPTVSA